jgi:hypothetical protein
MEIDTILNYISFLSLVNKKNGSLQILERIMREGEVHIICWVG